MGNIYPLNIELQSTCVMEGDAVWPVRATGRTGEVMACSSKESGGRFESEDILGSLRLATIKGLSVDRRTRPVAKHPVRQGHWTVIITQRQWCGIAASPYFLATVGKLWVNRGS